MDLDSRLTARLQAASFQLLAMDCAVFPDSEALGADVSSLFLSLPEEGMVLFTRRVSSRMDDDDCNTGQLLQ